jgi:hypothetical protein
MLQVKLFKSDNIVQLQSEINAFLKNLEEFNVKEVKFSATESSKGGTATSNYLAAVIYIPKPDMDHSQSS